MFTPNTPHLPVHTIGRRWRPLSCVVLAIAAVLALASCSSDGAGSATGAGHSLNIQLSYLKNTEFAGEYTAEDRGYFADEGIDNVTFTAGGSTATAAEPQVATGSAFLGITSPIFAAAAIEKGAPLKIVGATFQTNPFNVVSAADKPIASPEDFRGKTIAIQDFNTLVWNALLSANGISSDEVSTVPFTDGPAQLLSGQVDGYLTYVTGFTGTIGASGRPATELRLSDANLPMVSEVIIASTDTIENDRERLSGALTAIAKGWRDAIADNDAALSLTLDNYGSKLNLDRQQEQRALAIQNPMISTADTDAHGLLTVTPELQNETVHTLQLAGIDLSADDLFDLSVLDEIYNGNPKLTA